MSSTLMTLLPTAIALIVSPIPIIELILVLFSKRRTINAIVFLVSVFILAALTLWVGSQAGQASGSDQAHTSKASGVVLVVLALLLLYMALRNWRNRADDSVPALLEKIQEMGPAAVAVLSLSVVVTNPKNLMLYLAAGQTLASSQNPLRDGLVFLVVATIPFTSAAAYSLFGGQSAQNRLDVMRVWLMRNNRAIMAVICLLIGLVLLARGASALL